MAFNSQSDELKKFKHVYFYLTNTLQVKLLTMMQPVQILCPKVLLQTVHGLNKFLKILFTNFNIL